MKDEQRHLLSLLHRAPARLTMEQTAFVLNCQPDDISVLVAARLLKPLGNPPPNGTKFFAADEIIKLAGDRNWLSRITSTICRHWHDKNLRRRDPSRQTVGDETATDDNDSRAHTRASDPELSARNSHS